MATPVVAILMGSDSDLPVMAGCAKVLEQYGIPYDIRVLSAHRSPEEARHFSREAEANGFRLIVCGAGGAAHLAGAVAAHSTLPVIGVPLASSPLSGFDALLSTVQMPPGVPVATVAIGKPGATNAGVLAAQMIALADESVAARLVQYKKKLEEKVEAAARKLAGG